MDTTYFSYFYAAYYVILLNVNFKLRLSYHAKTLMLEEKKSILLDKDSVQA